MTLLVLGFLSILAITFGLDPRGDARLAGGEVRRAANGIDP